MTTIYDATTGEANERPRPIGNARQADFHSLPDVYNPPRRRLHPMLLAGLMFGTATVAFYGAEASFPEGYKPSRFTGGYERAMAAARTEGELRSRIAYDARFKLVETAAVAWQEQCKVGLQNYNHYYQAVYARANNYAQSLAHLQSQYAGTRLAIAQGSIGGELGAANTATSLGYIFGFFDPELGREAMEFAENARQQAFQKLDEAANSGIQISVEGWNTNLPDPTSMPPLVKCDLPTAFSLPQPSSEG